MTPPAPPRDWEYSGAPFQWVFLGDLPHATGNSWQETLTQDLTSALLRARSSAQEEKPPIPQVLGVPLAPPASERV